MRKVFWQISTTLDGFMEDSEKKLELTAQIEDEEFEAYASKMLESIGAFVVGRKTYELFVSYWPTATGRDAEILNSLPKYVVSTSLDQVEWNNAELISGDIEERIRTLKGQDGGEIAVFGSATLASSLLDMGLIDECRIMITPYLLASGSRTFRADGAPRGLNLTGFERWNSGTVFLTYAPDRGPH